ncbi:MAG: cytochrome c maturation protein CcmE [Gemmatimonadota bacterium]|nr:cytochrome c maturation protein CcmE [Gemmatimonadota bacterium]
MKKNRLWMLAGLVAIAGAIGVLAAGGLGENMVFFLTPTELEAKTPDIYGSPVRLGGQVKPASVDWNAESRELRFVIMEEGVEIRVESEGAPPAMFADGMGVVVEGVYHEDGVFRSTNVMVKHSNEYEPPHDELDARDTYRSLLQDGS